MWWVAGGGEGGGDLGWYAVKTGSERTVAREGEGPGARRMHLLQKRVNGWFVDCCRYMYTHYGANRQIDKL